MDGFLRDGRGTAVPWFAFAAVVLTLASVAGAQALDWLSRSGRVTLEADRALTPAQRAAAVDPGIDLTPTGSIPPKSRVIESLVIRIR